MSNQTGYPDVNERTFVDAANGLTRANVEAGKLAPGGEEAVLLASPKNPVRLRGGQLTRDPRLTRLPEFDPRSRNYPMEEVLDDPVGFLAQLEEGTAPEVEGDLPEPKAAALPSAPKYKDRSYTWGLDTHFDQGLHPSCVGHGWGHELVARPVVVGGIDQPFCFWLYKTSQRYDAWSGENYAGTSVIAGAKVIQKRPPAMPEGRGLMLQYRWIFGDMGELIKTLGSWGPVVAGSWWTMDMFDPDKNGYIHPTGEDAGGHCYLLRGYNTRRKAVLISNSWGTGWGEEGDAWMKIDEFEALINREGELCVPVRRQGWGD